VNEREEEEGSARRKRRPDAWAARHRSATWTAVASVCDGRARRLGGAMDCTPAWAKDGLREAVTRRRRSRSAGTCTRQNDRDPLTVATSSNRHPGLRKTRRSREAQTRSIQRAPSQGRGFGLRADTPSFALPPVTTKAGGFSLDTSGHRVR
jgi:hypothetical protein